MMPQAPGPIGERERMVYEKQMRMNARSPTRSGVISSPDPRDQAVIQGQSGSPVFERQNDLVFGNQNEYNSRVGNQGFGKGFNGQERAAAVNMSFDDGDVLTNSIGEEDYIPDTDGSIDDHIKSINNGVESSVNKAKKQSKNLPQ